MAEQISRRAQNVTVAQFEGPFEQSIVRFGVGGLNLKDSLDAMEGWSRLTNIWHENEAEATARPGETSLATGLSAPVHSIRKLRNPKDPSVTRFWGGGSSLYRGLSGAVASVASGFSGSPLALVPHRPNFAGSDGWLYVGDSTKMVKVRDDGLALPIGLPAPAAPTAKLGTLYRWPICQCTATDDTEAADWTPAPGKDTEGTPTNTPEAADPDTAPGSKPALYFVTDPGSITSAYDSWWGVDCPRDLTILGEEPGLPGTTPASDDDIIHFWMKLSHPHLTDEVRVYLVCSEDFDPLYLPGVMEEGTGLVKNPDAYVKAFRPNDYVQFVQAKTSQIQAAEQARIYALRDKDAGARAYRDERGSWQVRRAESDPGRAPSFQLGVGSHQWFSYGEIGSALRRGEFSRIGSTEGRDWSTITGVIVYIRTRITEDERAVGVGFGDFYITGGFGPDTVQPGAQQYDYRVTHYDPRTGAEGNPSEVWTAVRTDDTFETLEAAPIDAIRRHIVVDPPAYGDAAVRQRIYRRGGSLIDDWYYCGENTSDGGTFTDDLSDDAVASAGTVEIDHYQPVPTVDSDGDTVLAQPLRSLWGPIEGMLFGCGDPYRPGYVYFSLPDAPEHWSAFGNVEVCAPSEELMGGGVAGHQGFVFSRLRLYFLYPNLSGQIGQVTATPALCTRGLLGYWSYCIGPGGVIYFVSEDGVWATAGGGPEEWLSEAINPLFYGSTVNGYAPIDKTQTHMLRLTCWENGLYVQYQDTNGAVQVVVYSILQKFWRHYDFGREPACVQGEDEDVLLLGGKSTGVAYTHDGTSDDGLPIACTVRTGSTSGNRREEKLFGDIFLDADLAGGTVDLVVFLNEETHANTPISVVTGGGSARQRFLVHAFGESPQKAHSIACQLSWSSSSGAPTLYQLGYALTLQPDVTNTRVTNWDDLNSPDEVWLTGLTLDVDTGNATKTFHIERDFNGERSIVATFHVTSDNRHKFKFSWPAVPANQVRLRPEPDECAAWILYRADWIYQQEPPRISKWDIHFENEWDQYYTGLDLYCDTFGEEKTILVYVDGVQLHNDLASLDYWPVVADGRQVVHLTLPWGRGHVFRFVAIDDFPGLLYTHRWHLQPEPSEQANWNQNFSVLGTRADKWLKAVVFECDTYGADKAVQVEVDGTVVETLTVNTTGRRVVQLALSQQHLGRVWRLFPVDANPGRLYSAEPIFDEEPFALTRWETQETNHGLAGWFYPLYGHITIKSSADVTLTTAIQHNQVGGTTTDTYVIPSTAGQKQRRFLAGFHATKGVLIKYLLTSASPFWLYRDETVVVIQPWGAANPITVQPFGNDDQDPSRPMTHAVLAAQASGGAASAAGGGGA